MNIGNFELNKIYCMDCLEGLKQIPDKSVDLVVTDPPYFNVMRTDWKGNKHSWDSQWNNLDEYRKWIFELGKEIKRILKLNGSFYIFADDKICAYVQVELDKLFNLENSITWAKPNNMTIKGWNIYRCYATITEKILFYSNESRNTNLENESYSENIKVLAPIIEYMIEQKRLIKEYFNFKTDKVFNDYINKLTNTKSIVSRHYFTYSQWVFPTENIYKKLQTINNEVFKKEYEVFKKEYEGLRRVFKPKENFTDVWTFNIMGGKESLGKHPTQKPLEIIKRMVDTSSKENQIILDPFMGSGTTAVACKQLGRNFIGFEISQEYVDIANKRLQQGVLF